MAPSRPERRKSLRVQLRVTVHVQLAGQPRSCEAVSRDLSVAGIALFLHLHLPHCTPVYLEFHLPGSLATLYCPAHVVWCTDAPAPPLPGQEPCYVLGLEFVRTPPGAKSELKRFVTERLNAADTKTSA